MFSWVYFPRWLPHLLSWRLKVWLTLTLNPLKGFSLPRHLSGTQLMAKRKIAWRNHRRLCTLSSFRLRSPTLRGPHKGSRVSRHGSLTSASHIFFPLPSPPPPPHTTPWILQTDSCGKNLTHFPNLYANQVGLTVEESGTWPGLKAYLFSLWGKKKISELRWQCLEAMAPVLDCPSPGKRLTSANVRDL